MSNQSILNNQLNTHSALGWRFWCLSILWFCMTITLWFFIANGAASDLIAVISNNKPIKDVRFIANITELEYWKNFGYFVGTLGVGPIAIYLASIRTRVAAEQLSTDRSKLETEQERVANDRTKSVNEAFAKSIELLGGTQVTVRQGAIYALARLSKLEESTLHATIVRIFVSFVRDQSKTFKAAQSTTPSSTLPVDVETALYAIRDRNASNDYEHKKRVEAKDTSVGFLFDMSNSFLLNADLDRADFEGFNISDSKIEGCSFIDTKLSRANFVGTEFVDCDFTGATAEGADFSGAKGLTQSVIDQIKGNSLTKIPEGLTAPSGWK